MNNRIPAIVLDANLLHQLTTIQALGKYDIPIVAVSNKKDAIGFASKYPVKRIVAPMPCYEPSFINFLADKVDRGVLFSGYDATADLFSKVRSDLKALGFLIRISDYATHLGLYDKFELGVHSEASGIRYPKSVLLRNESELTDMHEKISYPFILKPTKGDSGLYYFVEDESTDLRALYLKLRQTLDANIYTHSNSSIIAQEFIATKNQELWNYNALYCSGSPMAEFTGLRIRSSVKPDGSLGSTLLYGRSKTNSQLNKLNQDLLGQMKFDGMVETEWAFDTFKRAYVLFDVNARPSGNIKWSITGGVNLVYLYYLSCQQQMAEGCARQKDNVFYHKIFWFESDLLYALRRKINQTKRKKSVFRNILNSFLRNRSKIMDVSDAGGFQPAVSHIKMHRVLRDNLKTLLAPRANAVDVLDFNDLKPSIKIVLGIIYKIFGRLFNLKIP